MKVNQFVSVPRNLVSEAGLEELRRHRAEAVGDANPTDRELRLQVFDKTITGIERALARKQERALRRLAKGRRGAAPTHPAMRPHRR